MKKWGWGWKGGGDVEAPMLCCRKKKKKRGGEDESVSLRTGPWAGCGVE